MLSAKAIITIFAIANIVIIRYDMIELACEYVKI